MPARTRANSTATATTSAPPNLAAAPRRRVKITPLDNDTAAKSTKNEQATRPATRATRSKASVSDNPEESVTTITKSATTTKPRGRPKKSEAAAEPEVKSQPERLAEKPKRATRSTRATATTVSSEAKEKPSSRTTRAAKGSSTATRSADTESGKGTDADTKQDHVESEKPRPVKTALKKKVTFQDIEDDKENQPITRAAKKATGTKSAKTSASVGLKAKPVRKPATVTRASKRTKDAASDDEEDQKPKKIQRILTPKKITQLNRPLTPDEASEDELSGSKTPVRDLTGSPKRPQTTATIEAIAKTLSPAKTLSFSQSVLQQPTRKPEGGETSGPLASPARRAPVSPAKLFSQSTLSSATKIFKDDAGHGLASPARRPAMSPVKEGQESSSKHVFGDASKLLFPNAHKSSQQSSFSQSSSNLLQSPKRSAVFDPARIFAHSAIKPQTTNLSKSSFFSSPAKRTGIFSPLKKSTTPDATRGIDVDEIASPELNLNDMEITNLLGEQTIEISATSYQRASVSPLRTYKLSEDELNMDFDDSVLAIRSPLKVAKSPVKVNSAKRPRAVIQPSVQDQDDKYEDDDETEALSSPQSVPHVERVEKSFVSLQDMDAEVGSKLKDVNPDLTRSAIDDDTLPLSELAMEGTPRAPIDVQQMMDTSLDDLAPSPQEDLMSKYIRTPGTPATIHEHELTNMISPSARSDVSPVTMLHEHELTNMLSSPSSEKQEPVHSSPSIDQRETIVDTPKNAKVVSDLSPVSLHEHELTNMLSSPAMLEENELTQMVAQDQEELVEDASMISIHEHEMTNMLSSPQQAEQGKVQPSPAPLEEHEPTNMMDTQPIEQFEPETSPVSIHEHELTNMLSSPAPRKAMTPNLPIPRKFNLNTVVTKVPLKPEGQESPFKLTIKKRKRPLSLGGQPDFVDILQPKAKSPRTSTSPQPQTSHVTPAVTPASTKSAKTPVSRVSTIKGARRAVSTPEAFRKPLVPVANGVLTGAVAFVDVRTSEGADASAIYVELLTSLGAKVVSSIADASLLTHVVYKDGNVKTLEKLRRVSMGDGVDVKIVRVSWVLDCDAKQEWVDENDYFLNLAPTDYVVGSVSRSAKRKSMEPSMLIADGSGSVKRSRSKNRASMRRSSIRPLIDNVEATAETPSSNKSSKVQDTTNMATPIVSTAKKQKDLDKNSLTAAWKSINATQNLGEDTPARRTLELLQKTYAMEQDDWDSSILSATTTNKADDEDDEAENDENTPRPASRKLQNTADNEDGDKDILETGLTPAPYRVKAHTQIGSAPAKGRNVELMSYRERVEEMERRELRDNALGVLGGKAARGKGKRVTMFGEDFGR